MQGLTCVMYKHKSSYKNFIKRLNLMNKNYTEQNVTYMNTSAKITLSGTITLPISTKPVKHPVVLLIVGYGPHDRDASFMGNKPFATMAEHFAKKGIASLRYDKRGCGQSTGDCRLDVATSRDFANDAIAGINYLKTRSDIDIHNIGLVGISEGGFIASMVATEIPGIAFIALLASAILTKINHFVEMYGLQMLADGASKDFIKHDAVMRTHMLTVITQEPDAAIAEKKIRSLIEKYISELSESEKKESVYITFAVTTSNINSTIKTFNSKWYRYFLHSNPCALLSKLTMPVLAINGGLDWISQPTITFPIMEAAFKAGKVNNYTFIKVPQINHMFMECKTGAMSEYATIREGISLPIVDRIADWIISKIKK